MMGGTSDKTVFEELVSTLSKKLEVYDQILAKQKYLGGNVRLSSVSLPL
jgi:hypothetical protein